MRRPILRLKSERGATEQRPPQAPAPRAIIGGNHVAADLLSQMAADKFVHHLPEHRQARRLAQQGATIPTSTLNDWMHRMADRLHPLYETLCEAVRHSDYLQVDEVPWRVADRPGRCRMGYAWQFRDASPGARGLYFYYLRGSRAGEIPRAQLRDFHGAVQTDGYKVYDFFEDRAGVTLLGRMAHVRRKFTDAQDSDPGRAGAALRHIALLYELEDNLRSRGAPPDEVAAERRGKGLPILAALDSWAEAAAEECDPGGPLYKALVYLRGMMPRLRRYALDGRYQIDNNAVERGQRPTVLGRKNFLFSKNDRGAEDNATFYSLLGSREMLGVNPQRRLEHVLDHLPDDAEEEVLERLLPHNFKDTFPEKRKSRA